MFNKTKYTKIYYNIINRAKNRSISGYTEKHHIIPRSLGGTNDTENIAILTAKEHFICHLLLIKMVEEDMKYKMVYAAWQQARPRYYTGLKVTSRVYEMLRIELSKSYTGRKRAPFTEQAKANMKAAAQTRNNPPMTEHRLQRIREGVAKREKLTGEQNPFFGKTHSVETIEKIVSINKRVYTCPHCNKEGASNVMQRWHFENCKFR